MEKVLFISNNTFINPEVKMNGGVRLCTKDFISLISSKFEITYFPINYDKSLIRKVKTKLGIDVFNDYNPEFYKYQLEKTIARNQIKIVFINLSNAINFSTYIKRIDERIKVILCSHGIEGGDFIHNIVRNEKKENLIKNVITSYKFGKIFKKDIQYRIESIDIVLTVSEVEAAIESWLGAKEVVLVPRVLTPNFLDWKPKKGRLGFVGDVSHFPNYYGLDRFCQALSNDAIKHDIEVVIVGKPCENLNILKSKYSFIKLIGYLNEYELQQEASSWMYFLNLVYYYSKGVSTKLQLGLNWGLPVLTTRQGNRGYVLNSGEIPICKNEYDMLDMIKSRFYDDNLLIQDKKKIEEIVKKSSSYSDIMSLIIEKIENK